MVNKDGGNAVAGRTVHGRGHSEGHVSIAADQSFPR
jgi:hypothetical protein